MDEPFSAVDPVVREQLQDEFLRLQADISKTIVMVTHDIEEALKLGDRVAVLRQGGTLAQFASPADLLESPSDTFTANFIGSGRGYHALEFHRPPTDLTFSPAPTVTVGEHIDPLDAAGRWILVVDQSQRPMGWVDAHAVGSAVVTQDNVNLSGTFARRDGSLRDLLNSALSSPSGRGVVVGGDGALVGTVTDHDVIDAISHARNEQQSGATA